MRTSLWPIVVAIAVLCLVGYGLLQTESCEFGGPDCGLSAGEFRIGF